MMKAITIYLIIFSFFFLGCNTTTDQEVTPTSSDVNLSTTQDQVELGVVDYIELDVTPKPKTKISPVYPEEARKAGIDGAVYVKVLIDENGEIIKTEITKSSGVASLDNSALESLKDAKFSAGKKDGKPVKVWITLPIKYALNKGDKK
jgi:TonB family protein